MSRDKTRIGFIGTGGRGQVLLREMLSMDDVAIPAVCDLNPENRSKVQNLVEAAGRPRPDAYADYRELLERGDIQGVLICTGWTSHLRIAMDAMRKGIYAAPEVGPANSVGECWELVATYHDTGVPCMLLENCCFMRDEMAILNMARQSLFGEIVHCEAGYQHELRERLVLGKGTGIHEKGTPDYRSVQNLRRNADIYPTHGLGPMAKILDIHRGNRFLKLVSTASKARGLAEWAESNLAEDHPAFHRYWARGDVVTTVLTCANGETLILKLITTLPAPASRLERVHGTRGVWMQECSRIYLENESPGHAWEDFQPYRDKYDHPLWKTYRELGVKTGHSGADFVVLRIFVDCVRDSRPTPIDAYDTAAWTAVGALSEDSIALGGAPVAFPDFTGGTWLERGQETLAVFGQEYPF